MMEHQMPFESRIDAYLDGALAGDELERFETALASSDALSVEVTRGRQIGQSLQRLFEPPHVPQWARVESLMRLAGSGWSGSVERSENGVSGRMRLVQPAESAPQHDSGLRRRRLIVGIAASVLLVLSGVVVGWMTLQQRGGEYDSSQWRTLAQVYEDLERPQFVPKTDEQFARTFAARFGQAIHFDSDAPDVSVQGIAFCHSISRDTTCLFATAGGEKTLVFVDRLERDTQPQLPPDSGLRLFRKELGELVLYELTRNDRAMMLDWVYKAADS